MATSIIHRATLFLRHFEPLSRVMQYGLVAQRLLGGEEQPAGGRLPIHSFCFLVRKYVIDARLRTPSCMVTTIDTYFCVANHTR
jgi:hypothetical protein